MKHQTDWEKHNLKGKVYSIRKIEYETVENFREIVKGSQKAELQYLYNENGNKIIEEFDKGYGLRRASTYEYDDKGNKTRTYIKSKKYQNPDIEFIYKYDKGDKLIEFENNELWECDETDYDGYQNYSIEKVRQYGSTYKYDENGNKIIEESWAIDEGLTSKSTYKYDDKGNKIELTHLDYYYEDLEWKDTYNYNENGYLIEESFFEPNGLINSKNYFDNNGNIIQHIEYDSDGSLSLKVMSEFNSRGHLIKKEEFRKYGTFHKKFIWKFTYDSKGNWIKCIEFEVKNEALSIPKLITERKIEYYD